MCDYFKGDQIAKSDTPMLLKWQQLQTPDADSGNERTHYTKEGNMCRQLLIIQLSTHKDTYF